MLNDCGGTVPDAVIVLAGGTGRRLGGVSKPDFLVGNERLLDLLFANLPDGIVHRVVVGPETLRVPSGVDLTLENPPLGGPAAGVGAGVTRFSDLPGESIVALATCDAPLAPLLHMRLVDALRAAGETIFGAVPITGGRFHYLLGVYRLSALRTLQISRDQPVRQIFSELPLTRIPGEHYCFDVDTTADAIQLVAQLDDSIS